VFAVCFNATGFLSGVVVTSPILYPEWRRKWR
jgi:hypothetical protein